MSAIDRVKPNLNTPINIITDADVNGVAVYSHENVVEALWGGYTNYIIWAELWKLNNETHYLKETSRIINEWIRNLGMEGEFYFYGSEHHHPSVFIAGGEEAKEKGFSRCIVECVG